MIKSNQNWQIITAAVVAVLVVIYLGLCAFASMQGNFYPNTTVNGIDVGRMTLQQALAEVQVKFPTRVIAFECDGESLGSTTVEELGYTGNDLPQQVQLCMNSQQNIGFFRSGWQYLLGMTGHGPRHTFIPQRDDAVFTQYTQQLADSLYLPQQDADYVLTEDHKLLTTVPADGRKANESELRSLLQDAVDSGAGTVEVPFQTLHAKVITAQAMYHDLHGKMKNASYDVETKSISQEQVGVDFDVTSVQSLLDHAKPGSTLEVPATIEYPQITAEKLEPVLFRDVLGQARTHVSGTAARISNVKLASSAFNGTVLNSGDVFSYNGVVGQRTEARGYLPAPAYVAGETVDELGGGVCQPSSTLYLACLLADMEIVERTNHRYVPAYIDWGMDATVSWGTLDYKFSNNTPYPVKIVTTYENNYLTVKLLGTNDTGKHAAMTNKVISETPWETIYVDDPTMAPGSPNVVKTTPYVGYKVEAYHTIYDADGKVISQHLESVNNYKVRNKVVLRAPALPADAELPTTPSVPTVNDQPIEEPSWNPIQESPAPQGPDGDFSDFLDEGSYGIL